MDGGTFRTFSNGIKNFIKDRKLAKYAAGANDIKWCTLCAASVGNVEQKIKEAVAPIE